MRISAILIILFLLLPNFALALKTQEYRLPNGLKIIVREDHRAPVVFSSVWYKVGGSYESNGYTGISHMLEHMMFKGTRLHGPGEFNKLIAAAGGSQNAITSGDYTVYYQELPAHQLALSFELEADRMHNLLLDSGAFEKEKKVVMEERRMRVDNDPQGLMWERFHATAFVNNPYHHPVIGWMTDIKNFNLSDLQSWYQRWYAPNNAVVVVVGDVDSDDVFRLAQKYFGPLKAATIEKLKPRNEVTSFGKKSLDIHVPAQAPVLFFGFNVPTLPTIDHNERNEIYALKLAEYLLSKGKSSRLQSELVRKKQTAVYASANYELYNLHQSLFLLMGIPDPKSGLQKLEKAFLNQLNQLKTKTIKPAELRRVKAQLIADDIYKEDTLMNAAFSIGEPEMSNLSWRDSEVFSKHMMAVTPEQVQAAAKKYFSTSELTVAKLIPIKKAGDNN